MKNKEIEELLNELQRRKERYDYCKNNDISFSDEDYKSYLLLSYIEQLENNRDKALKIIDSYDLGKYDYSIPPGGIIELREALKGDSDE